VRQLLDPEAPPAEQYAETSYNYDNHGNLTRVTDANGNLTTYLVDDLGNTVSTSSPVTGLTTMGYEPTGQLLEMGSRADDLGDFCPVAPGVARSFSRPASSWSFSLLAIHGERGDHLGLGADLVGWPGHLHQLPVDGDATFLLTCHVELVWGVPVVA
jgi:hypothetical protein